MGVGLQAPPGGAVAEQGRPQVVDHHGVDGQPARRVGRGLEVVVAGAREQVGGQWRLVEERPGVRGWVDLVRHSR